MKESEADKRIDKLMGILLLTDPKFSDEIPGELQVRQGSYYIQWLEAEEVREENERLEALSGKR